MPPFKELVWIFSAVIAHLIILSLISWLIAVIFKVKGRAFSYLLLTIVICNSGNYPVPINFFAYGETGMTYALLVMIANIFITTTVGVWLASSNGKFLEGLKSILSLPLIYALLLPFALKFLGWHIPDCLMKAIHLLGQAAIPMDLIVLGSILAMSMSNLIDYRSFVSIAVRLLISPLLGILIVLALGITGQMQKSLIITFGMPTAVYTSILATQFDGDKEFAAGAVLLSTICSLLTVPLILWLLG